MNSKILDHLIRKKGTGILITLLSNSPLTASYICKKVDVTFSHGNNLIKELVKSDLIKREIFDGRTFNLFLTEKGKKIAESLKFIKDNLEE